MKLSWYLLLCSAVSLTGCKGPDTKEFDDAIAKYPALESQAKSLGLPLTGKDLMTTPPPDADNGFDAFTKAFSEYRAATLTVTDFSLQISRLGAFEPTKAREWEAKFKIVDSALDRVVDASKLSQWDYKRNWDAPGFNVMAWPEYASVKTAIRMLGLRAQVRASKGDLKGAASDLRASTSLAGHVGSDPTLISLLVQIAAQSMVVRATELCLVPAGKNRDFLQDVCDGMSLYKSADFKFAMRGEMAYMLGIADNPATYTREGLKDLLSLEQDEDQLDKKTIKMLDDILPKGVDVKTLSKAYRSIILETWIDFFGSARAMTDPVQLQDALAKSATKFCKEDEPTHQLNRALLPVYGSTATIVLRDEAQRRCMAMLLSTLQGRPGQTLPGYSTKDPFGPGQLKIKHDDGKVVVYSFGPNKTDEGGKDGLREDIAVVFPRVNKAPVPQGAPRAPHTRVGSTIGGPPTGGPPKTPMGARPSGASSEAR